MKDIYLAGGCFWGLQKYFDLVDGVIGTEVGYANGKEKMKEYNIEQEYIIPIKKMLN